MKKLILAIAFALLAFFASGSVYADSLSSLLLPGGSITAGDKLFDGFQVMLYDASGGRSFNAANIEVAALSDGGMSPGPGLKFTALNDELTVKGDGIRAFVNLTLSYRVTVLDPAKSITDGSLEFSQGGAFLSWVIDDSYNLGNYIGETIGTAAGSDDLGIENIEFSVLGKPEIFTSKISDSAIFAPQSEIWVTTNIRIWAVDQTDSAGTWAFEQRFSQTSVPEPSTFLLVGLGLAGVALVRRSRSTGK